MVVLLDQYFLSRCKLLLSLEGPGMHAMKLLSEKYTIKCAL